MTAIDLARNLIAFDSVSRRSNVAVTEYVEQVLSELGFECERIDYDDPAGVRKANVIGKVGRGQGGMAYFGHTDVVPAETWRFSDHGPFESNVKDGRLYGRGEHRHEGLRCLFSGGSLIDSP